VSRRRLAQLACLAPPADPAASARALYGERLIGITDVSSAGNAGVIMQR
jgi:hypothetical protein